MGYFIIFLVVGFFITLISNENRREYHERRGVVLEIEMKYIGGFSDINGGYKANIEIKENEIEITIGDSLTSFKKNIPMDMVINAEIKSETQITQEVGLGKMIVFGALAFGMKNKKNIVNNYLVINCDENGNKRDLIFESGLSEIIVKEIRNIKGIESIF